MRVNIKCNKRDVARGIVCLGSPKTNSNRGSYTCSCRWFFLG